MESSDRVAHHGRPLHVVFFPFMATGHMPPMVDMATLFSSRGVAATVVTTPANAPLVDSRRGLPGAAANIGLRTLPFPSPALTGLPPGIKNFEDLSDSDSLSRFMVAVRMLREPFSLLLREMRPVDAVVSDYFFPWTIPIAEELGIPRLVFHGTGFFALCAKSAAAAADPVGGGDTIVLDGLPRRVVMLRSQMPDVSKQPPVFRELHDEIAATERRSYGVVVNSFYELEPEYARHYREAMGRRAWHVGPIALCSRDGALLQQRRLRPKEEQEDEEAQERKEIAYEPTGANSGLLEWLDRNRPGSVLYVCFGSKGRLGAAQLRQLALGLEASGCPFIWVVRDSDDEAEWLPRELKERVKDRGLVLKGWAPQTLILGHASVGAFVTHCGWNSCLEGVCAGVPMVTWPLSAEQFFNERLLVDVLRIGVPVGATKFAYFAAERPVIEGAQIEAAIRKVMMGGGDDAAAAAEEMRRRAGELGEAAKRATEPGGSSYVDLVNLIQELMDRRSFFSSFFFLKSSRLRTSGLKPKADREDQRNCNSSKKYTGLREQCVGTCLNLCRNPRCSERSTLASSLRSVFSRPS